MFTVLEKYLQRRYRNLISIMKKVHSESTIPQERILRKIFVLRDEKVMLDVHLAELYGVETRVLKQAVKRNPERFPGDLMFELSDNEIKQVVSQNVIPHKKYFGGAKPFAFTETGVAMLSSVLKSKQAVQMNLSIMRTFVALRKLSIGHKDILQLIAKLDSKYKSKFKKVDAVLNYLLQPPNPPRQKIGYKINSGD